MRQTLHKIVSILDGQPTGVRGQSLVEMTITFPLLILMVLSLVEVGFVANNYLILMDVVRAAGRAAVTTNPDSTQWPDNETRSYNRMDCDQPETGNHHDDTYHRLGNANVPGTDPILYDERDNVNPAMPGGGASQTGPRGQHLQASYSYSLIQDGPFGFFDSVACQVTRGMAPLVLNDDDSTKSKDDIVVSTVSYELMTYGTGITHGDNVKYAAGPGAHHFGTQDFWVTVTNRWPMANRYCVTNPGQPNQAGDGRDPMDFMRDDFNTAWTNGGPTLDKVGSYGEGLYNQATKTYIAGSLATGTQGVRGFVFTGNNMNPDGCYGSRFTVQEIEARLNLDTNLALNSVMPNGGLVIVEIFWQHHPLFLGPIFQGYNGNKLNDPVLWVWGWFPLPNIEPTATPSS